MTGLKLYETVDALDQVAVWLAEAEGELTPEIEAALEAAGIDFTDKVERVAIKVLELRATAKAQKEEAERVAARAKASQRDADSLARYLRQQLDRAGVPRVEGLRCTVAVQTNPPSIVGELDEQALRTLAVIEPTLVRRVPETFALDRRAALEAVKNGRMLPTGLTVEHSRTLRIR